MCVSYFRSIRKIRNDFSSQIFICALSPLIWSFEQPDPLSNRLNKKIEKLRSSLNYIIRRNLVFDNAQVSTHLAQSFEYEVTLKWYFDYQTGLLLSFSFTDPYTQRIKHACESFDKIELPSLLWDNIDRISHHLFNYYSKLFFILTIKLQEFWLWADVLSSVEIFSWPWRQIFKNGISKV